MFPRRFGCAAVLFAVTGSVLAADDDLIKKENEKIQGTWQVTSMEILGNAKTDVEVAAMQLTIKGDQFTLTGLSKDDIKGFFRIVEVKGKTRQTDLRQKADGDAELLTIAEWIAADSFRTCFADKQRPTKFASTGDGGGKVLMVLKRLKK